MFVHLHVHSGYSILDALPAPEELAKRARELGMPALALTDHGNMHGAVEFFKACKAEGIKPIIGCEMYVAPTDRREKVKGTGGKYAYHLTLLAKDMQGYKNLCRLSSIAYLEGFYYHPRIDNELLHRYSEGLICLSGCMSSEISQLILAGSSDLAKEKINEYRKLFGKDFYLEIQRHGMTPSNLEEGGFQKEAWLLQQYESTIEKQKRLEEALVLFSKELDVPLVATNDVHYLDQSDWASHEILINVQSGEPCETWELDSLGNRKARRPNPRRRVYSTHELYFKTAEEMSALFSDLPDAVRATVEIAEKCDVAIDFKTRHYPVYTPPLLLNKKVSKEERDKAVADYLMQLCKEGIPHRYTPERLKNVAEQFPGRDPLEVVKSRLEMEMSIIGPKGMCDYLLIVWDFIHWAKQNGIPVGPGRGSGAGSIVLYLIGVTDIEPLRFHLFFERFINPERLSYPDIDVDICMARRGEVINYTLGKYGKENVAQIITFGTMKAKMSVKDVGRVLDIPLAKVNQIAKLIPEDLGITLAGALEKDPDLRAARESDEETKRLLTIAERLEGCIRSTGIHAAGIVVSGEPLTDHIPVCISKESELPATQYSMKPVEAVGMLKIDFLGLKTLTSIQLAVQAIKENYGKEIDWVNLSLEDKATFNLLNQGKTMGVFQLESQGMQELARQLHLDKFEEIIAVGALYRPGPMDMIPSFINRKHGREEIENDHPWMQEILKETYGIMVYQEQVMQIAVKLANYSLGEGDVLRRAMGKKDHDEMQRQRAKFVKGCLENQIPEETARLVFDKMEKFASYGFNKSHAAAYGYLSYVTAYLKANYPKEWLASLMTCDSSDISKVSKFIREAKAMGIDVLPPDVNESGSSFRATESGIRFAISAIKGVGEGVVEAVVKERKAKGKFSSLYDFISRMDLSRVGKKVIESLIEAGSFDFTGWTRDQLKMALEPMFESALKKQKDTAKGFQSLFDSLGDLDGERFKEPPKVLQGTPPSQILFREKALLGFFLTGHPMDAFLPLLKRLSCIALRQIETFESGTVFRSAILIETVTVRFSNKSQRKFAILTVSDGMVSYELPIWPELYEQKGHLLNENQLLFALLEVDREGEGIKLSCRWLDDLTAASEEMIAECDKAFDKAKSMQKLRGLRKETKEKAPKEEKNMSRVILETDIDALKMSRILEIKALFRRHSGGQPVSLHFMRGSERVGTLEIGKEWGVELTQELKRELTSVSLRLR